MPRLINLFPGPPPPPPPSGLLALIHPDPYVWLYSIDVPSTPISKYRLTSYPETVYFERTSEGVAIAYSPASIEDDEEEADTEGSIPKIALRVQNLTREAVALLEAYDGLIGQKVRRTLVKRETLPDGTPEIDQVYDILDSQATETEVELTLGRAALTDRKFPDRRTDRLRCLHKYGGAGCGYDTTRAGALQTCTKLEFGKNGCTEHGEDEEAATLPNRHPQRMLKFGGIPRTNGVGVS